MTIKDKKVEVFIGHSNCQMDIDEPSEEMSWEDGGADRIYSNSVENFNINEVDLCAFTHIVLKNMELCPESFEHQDSASTSQNSQIDMKEVIDKYGVKLLIAAVQISNCKVVKELLEYGVNPNDAIDHAYANIQLPNYSEGALETFMILLQGDSQFPVNFEYEVAPERVQNLIAVRQCMHKAVDERNWSYLNDRLDEEPNLKHFHDQNNQPLAARFSNSMKDVPEDILKRLNVDPQEHPPSLYVETLLDKTEIHEGKLDRSVLQQAYETIDSDPIGSSILKIASKIEKLRIEVGVGSESEYSDPYEININSVDANFRQTLIQEFRRVIEYCAYSGSEKVAKSTRNESSLKRPSFGGSEGKRNKKRARKNKSGSDSDEIEPGPYKTFARHFVLYNQECDGRSKTFSDIRDESKKILLVGEPGTGKTAIFKYIARKLTATYKRSVKSVDLKLHADILMSYKGKSFDEHEASKMLASMFVDEKELESAEEEVIFMFDGYDAVDPSYHSLLVDFFTNLRKRELWISTRPEYFDELKSIPELTAYTFEYFDHPQIWLFIHEILHAKNAMTDALERIKKVMELVRNIHCADNFKIIEMLTEFLIQNEMKFDWLLTYSSQSCLVEKIVKGGSNDETVWNGHTALAILSSIPSESVEHFRDLSIIKDCNDQKLFEENVKYGIVSMEDGSLKFPNPRDAEFLIAKYVVESLQSNGRNSNDDEKAKIEELIKLLLKERPGKLKFLITCYLTILGADLSTRLASLKKEMGLQLPNRFEPRSQIHEISDDSICNISIFLSDIDILNMIFANSRYAGIFNETRSLQQKTKLIINSDTLLKLSFFEILKQINFKTVLIELGSEREVEMLITMLPRLSDSITRVMIKTKIIAFHDFQSVLQGFKNLQRLVIYNNLFGSNGEVLDQLPELYSLELIGCESNTLDLFVGQPKLNRIIVNNNEWPKNTEPITQFVRKMPHVNLVTFYGSDKDMCHELPRHFPFDNSKAFYDWKKEHFIIKLVRSSVEGQQSQDDPMGIVEPPLVPMKLAISPRDPNDKFTRDDIKDIEDKALEDEDIDYEYLREEEGYCVVKPLNVDALIGFKKLFGSMSATRPLRMQLYSPPPRFVYIFEVPNAHAVQNKHNLMSAIAKKLMFDSSKCKILAYRCLYSNVEIAAIVTSVEDEILKKHCSGPSLNEKRIPVALK